MSAVYLQENSQNAPLVHATLETLLRFLNWIPLGYIFETKLISTLVYKVWMQTLMLLLVVVDNPCECKDAEKLPDLFSVPECSHVPQRDAEVPDGDRWCECQPVRGAVCHALHPHHVSAQAGEQQNRRVRLGCRVFF